MRHYGSGRGQRGCCSKYETNPNPIFGQFAGWVELTSRLAWWHEMAANRRLQERSQSAGSPELVRFECSAGHPHGYSSTETIASRRKLLTGLRQRFVIEGRGSAKRGVEEAIGRTMNRVECSLWGLRKPSDASSAAQPTR